MDYLNRLRNPDSQKNIRRIEQGTTRGFQVHVSRRGSIYTKLFSDQKCGGKDEALQAAVDYRDSLVKKLPRRAPRTPGATAPRSNTGHRGISKSVLTSTADPSKTYTCLQASAWPEEGRVVRKRFRYDVKNYEEVLQEAVKWRREMMAHRWKDAGMDVQE